MDKNSRLLHSDGRFHAVRRKRFQGCTVSWEILRVAHGRKDEFPTVTEEEIEDRSKADGFSKTIALGQTMWFITQCLARTAQHLDLTLVELLTLSLAILNGVMYFLWWHKPLGVRCPVRVYLLDELNERHYEPNAPNAPVLDYYGEFYWSLVY